MLQAALERQQAHTHTHMDCEPMRPPNATPLRLIHGVVLQLSDDALGGEIHTDTQTHPYSGMLEDAMGRGGGSKIAMERDIDADVADMQYSMHTAFNFDPLLDDCDVAHTRADAHTHSRMDPHADCYTVHTGNTRDRVHMHTHTHTGGHNSVCDDPYCVGTHVDTHMDTLMDTHMDTRDVGADSYTVFESLLDDGFDGFDTHMDIPPETHAIMYTDNTHADSYTVYLDVDTPQDSRADSYTTYIDNAHADSYTVYSDVDTPPDTRVDSYTVYTDKTNADSYTVYSDVDTRLATHADSYTVYTDNEHKDSYTVYTDTDRGNAIPHKWDVRSKICEEEASRVYGIPSAPSGNNSQKSAL